MKIRTRFFIVNKISWLVIHCGSLKADVWESWGVDFFASICNQSTLQVSSGYPKKNLSTIPETGSYDPSICSPFRLKVELKKINFRIHCTLCMKNQAGDGWL